MSGKNNVNPDHYKVAGRDRPNEVLVAEPRVPGEGAYFPPAKGRRPPNFIPGALPVGEAPPPRPRTSSATSDDSATVRGGTGAKTGERAAAKPRKRPAAKATARRGAGAKGRATSGGTKVATSARAKAARKRTTRTVTARKRSASTRRKRTTTR